ncbi:UMP kinase [Candidatus Persebacteraceae bacterium Df01]|jgi:uridylate kinase|uniref:Uridylate kinase n=1 Tax=Candidatus Doriopsillibacter californiensis TaxID=2970740 RepID=A0ABT7QME3_9GAMM|nr:UMP kinase [Candidatus Persebacteraceae bacterium Df01]
MRNAADYRRILLKISGEALNGGSNFCFNSQVLSYLADEVAAALAMKKQVAIVVGGGNIVRGEMLSSDMGVDRVTADYMGMLATVINGKALQSALNAAGIDTRLQSALNMEQVVAPYIREKAVRHLENGQVVIFAGGTGNPFFSTDTAAALRASEIGANALLKATNVDGVYSSDPAKNADAKRYDTLPMNDAINQQLRVMDATALALCRERKLPVHVFKLTTPGTLAAILKGQDEGTLLTC